MSKKHISIPNKAADSSVSAHFTQFLLSVQVQLYLASAGIRPPLASQCKQVAQLGHSCLPWRRTLGHHPPCCLPSLSQPLESQKNPCPHLPPKVPGSQLASNRQPSKAPCKGTERFLHGQKEEAVAQVQGEVYFWAPRKMPTRHTSPNLGTTHSHRKAWHSLRLLGS